ncbi:MAG: transcriptional regulator, partial [Pseudomonadota bacterium]|nr:transcriptional regulator [Pseudomonadota bacterium]
MSSSVEKVKEEFARRLNEAMDAKEYPKRGRAKILSTEFKISDKGAGKWLNGEAIPETSKIQLLASFLDTTSEYLLYGAVPVEDWDSNTPLDDDEVEIPFFKDFSFACGGGSIGEAMN